MQSCGDITHLDSRCLQTLLYDDTIDLSIDQMDSFSLGRRQDDLYFT